MTQSEIKTVCFTGHRKLHEQYYNGSVDKPGIWTDVYRALYAILEQMYKECMVRNFIAGGAIGVDTLAAQAVLALKAVYPDVQLIIARPFPSQASKWPKQSQALAIAIEKNANVIDVSPDPYAPQKMQVRNEWMIDRSHYILAVKEADIIKGGTANALQYAKVKRRTIGILNPNTLTTEWFNE